MIIITKRKINAEDEDEHRQRIDGVAVSDSQIATWRNQAFVLKRDVKTSLNIHVNL